MAAKVRLVIQAECHCGRTIYFNVGSRSIEGIERELERIALLDCVAAVCDNKDAAHD